MNPGDLSERWQTWAGSIAAALLAFGGWLLKRRAGTSDAQMERRASWLSRRLAVEKDLMIATRTIKTQEREIQYLMTALTRALETQELVKQATTIYAQRSENSSPELTALAPGSGTPSAPSSPTTDRAETRST